MICLTRRVLLYRPLCVGSRVGVHLDRAAELLLLRTCHPHPHLPRYQVRPEAEDEARRHGERWGEVSQERQSRVRI